MGLFKNTTPVPKNRGQDAAGFRESQKLAADLPGLICAHRLHPACATKQSSRTAGNQTSVPTVSSPRWAEESHREVQTSSWPGEPASRRGKWTCKLNAGVCQSVFLHTPSFFRFLALDVELKEISMLLSQHCWLLLLVSRGPATTVPHAKGHGQLSKAVLWYCKSTSTETLSLCDKEPCTGSGIKQPRAVTQIVQQNDAMQQGLTSWQRAPRLPHCSTHHLHRHPTAFVA